MSFAVGGRTNRAISARASSKRCRSVNSQFGDAVIPATDREVCEKTQDRGVPRVHNVLKCEMAIRANPDTTCRFRRGCGVGVGNRRYFATAESPWTSAASWPLQKACLMVVRRSSFNTSIFAEDIPNRPLLYWWLPRVLRGVPIVIQHFILEPRSRVIDDAGDGQGDEKDN